MPICETMRNANLLYPLAAHRKRRDPGEDLGAEQAGKPAVGDDQPERPVGRVQQPSRDRDALFLVGIEQRRAGLTLDDERELPGQVVGILQAGVHALRADRAVDVRGVAEQEAAAVAEARGASVMDAVGGKPGAGLERQSGSRLVAQGGNHGLEVHVVPVAQGRRQDADDPPVILPAHGEQQVKAILPQVDVDLVRNHAARHLRIGDEEHVLVGRARERDAVQLAHGAARSVASGDPGGEDLAGRTVGQLERCRDPVRLLLEADQLGVPLHRHAQVAKLVAHDPFVVVLAEDENERIGSQRLARLHPGERAPSSAPAPRCLRRCRACRAPAPDRRCRASRRSPACAPARPALSSAATARHAGR